MSRHSKTIPKFKSESAERAFWEAADNDSTQYVDWNEAQIAEFRNLQPSTQTISLRLPKDLLTTIRGHARRLDVPYQSLMKLWLAEKAAITFPRNKTKKAG
jgi:predicted DNA binding CopG/RHH family protein